MSTPLTFCKDGLRFTACPQDRGTFVSIALRGGCVAMILSPSETDELEGLLAAARTNRTQEKKDLAA